MNQTYVILVAAAVGMAAYVACAIIRHRNLKADDLLTFALWCATLVTGVFAFIGAFKLSRVAGQETNGLYVGIFGLCLVWLSIQKVVGMIRELYPRTRRATIPDPVSTVKLSQKESED